MTGMLQTRWIQRTTELFVASFIKSFLLPVSALCAPPSPDRRRFAASRRSSLRPRHDLLEAGKEPRPPDHRALISLLLIRPEAHLLHAQACPGGRRGERPRHHAFEAKRRPGVGQ